MAATLYIENQAAALVARAGIRAGDVDLARIARDGWHGWINAQLDAPPEDTQVVSDAIKDAKLQIAYEAGEGFAAKNEMRPLSALFKPTKDLWHLVDWQTKLNWEERIRPGNELLAATLLRVALSENQLRESVTDFWRDHFSINRDAIEDVQVALPTYDQEVLRRHALGNFREMLEAVATSTAMLAYLNNASSKASPANENYARELFELHGLGAQAYYNEKFDRWRDVPGAVAGNAEGFIDQDVYEAARAFTGWSYENGTYVTEGVELPKTGEFHYVEHWHDPYQKRVLGVEFDSHAAPLADGRKVLDLVADHPATALNVCRRLCQRFVADQPSDDLVKSTAQVFTAERRNPRQLALVMEHILLSKDFETAKPRLQRPLFLLASIQRSTGITLEPRRDLIYWLDSMGQRVYGWHTPAGHPLVSNYWQSPGLLIRRWRGLNEIWTASMEQAPNKAWASIEDFTQEWGQKLRLDSKIATRAKGILQKEWNQDERAIAFNKDDRWFAAQALTYITATPAYQTV
jgi:uncharacterized protein (DUF1800 family)